MYYTTLNKIRANNPCGSSWEMLLYSLGKTGADDAPLSLEYILNTLGLPDALWALRAVDGIEREARLFACDCAEDVLRLFEAAHPNDMRPRRSIEVARKFALGNATHEELAATLDAALCASWAAERAAKGPAARAAAAAAALTNERAAWAAAAKTASRTAAWHASRLKRAKLFRAYFCTPETSQP